MCFKDKVVIITGAGHGIGKRVAEVYAEKGAKVVIAEVNEEDGRNVEKSLTSKEQEALFIKTDVREPHDIVNLIEKTIHTYGKIDILINNAGVGAWKSPYDLSVEEWDNVINTNLRSVFLCSREAGKYMRKNVNGGSIVNIASTRAMMSEKNSESYAATKGGILALTHALAVSLGQDKITVNAISPGWIEVNQYDSLREIDHSQHPSGRVGKADDIARACLYLTNEENNFVTGINHVVDGGMTRKMMYEE